MTAVRDRAFIMKGQDYPVMLGQLNEIVACDQVVYVVRVYHVGARGNRETPTLR